MEPATDVTAQADVFGEVREVRPSGLGIGWREQTPIRPQSLAVRTTSCCHDRDSVRHSLRDGQSKWFNSCRGEQNGSLAEQRIGVSDTSEETHTIGDPEPAAQIADPRFEAAG